MPAVGTVTDTQRLVLVAVGFALTIDLLGAVEALMVGGTGGVRTWARRVPEAMAVMVAGGLVAALVAPAIGFRPSVYVLLVASAIALARVRIPEARRAMTLSRAIALLALGALGIAVFLVLASAIPAPG